VANWDGVEYRRVNSLQQWLADRALTGLPLDDVDSVLDVGCGDGRITAEIAARAPTARVVGIDPSPRMIAVAPRSDRVSFELGDVCSMTFRECFDTVVSFNALHWVADQRRALQRVAAALRPAGHALLVFVCRGSRPSLEDVAMQVATGPRWSVDFADFPPPFTHPGSTEWCDVAASCGLAVEHCDVEDLTWDFDSSSQFRHWCSVGFGAWTDRLPPAAAEAFVDDVVDAYEQVSGAPGRFRFLQLRAALTRAGVDPGREPAGPVGSS
jgi:trans-aconitate 2-methyltransferase